MSLDNRRNPAPYSLTTLGERNSQRKRETTNSNPSDDLCAINCMYPSSYSVTNSVASEKKQKPQPPYLTVLAAPEPSLTDDQMFISINNRISMVIY